VNPLLTAYLDAPDPVARETARLAWTAHVKANADSAAILLALLADPSTGGPHISPDAPPEVWGAWRDLNNVSDKD
jgi:hypothetical protein